MPLLTFVASDTSIYLAVAYVELIFLFNIYLLLSLPIRGLLFKLYT
jgi:hypothetical protein